MPVLALSLSRKGVFAEVTIGEPGLAVWVWLVFTLLLFLIISLSVTTGAEPEIVFVIVLVRVSVEGFGSVNIDAEDWEDGVVPVDEPDMTISPSASFVSSDGDIVMGSAWSEDEDGVESTTSVVLARGELGGMLFLLVALATSAPQKSVFELLVGLVFWAGDLDVAAFMFSGLRMPSKVVAPVPAAIVDGESPSRCRAGVVAETGNSVVSGVWMP